MSARGRLFFKLARQIAFSLFFAAVFFNRYYAYADCFDERGRCYVGGDIGVLTIGGMMWAPVSAYFALRACFTLFRLFSLQYKG